MFHQRLDPPKSPTTAAQRSVLPSTGIEGSPFAEFYPGLPRIATLTPTYYHHHHNNNSMYSDTLLHGHTTLDDYNNTPLPSMDYLFPSSNHRSLKQHLPHRRSCRRNHPYQHQHQRQSKRRCHAQEQDKVFTSNTTTSLSLFGSIPEPCGQVQEQNSTLLTSQQQVQVLDDDAVFEEMQLLTESLAPARQSVLSPPSSPLLSDLDDFEDFPLFP
ncbi:hypothetical protein EC973_003513 [Apophysomyces ossiformis]|uniref:Uncharacterized protein n=1 Tax=Apophysomyces ossiformis TaxID=679940 RepID=A0A8H7BLN4_9FUNG|nr:hypothetical protein EC973_003513 [Apophysomyces ossiformis]